MSEDETPSLREEQGKPPLETPAERMARVPLAPHNAGALGAGADGAAPSEGSSASADREAAERREKGGPGA